MKLKEYRFNEVTINYDKKRIPLSGAQRKKRQGTYRYFGAQGVIDYIDDYIFDGTYLLIAEDGENLKSKKQNIAQIVEGQFWVNNHAHIVQGNELCDTRYLCYLLNSMDLSGYITGSAQPKLSQANLNAVTLLLPSIDEQRKIAAYLNMFDYKIAVNQQISDDLQQQTDLLFENIFADETDFVELGSMVETISGGTPSRKNPKLYENPSIHWVKSKELTGNFIHDTEEKINEVALTKSAAKLLPPHSVLVAMYGATVGEYGIIATPMACNQAICALLPNDSYSYSYLYKLIKYSKDRLKNMAVGSAQQNISQILIKQLPIHAQIRKVKRFSNAVAPSFQMIETLTLENIRLALIRDNLLPKLMSGEIDVRSMKN